MTGMDTRFLVALCPEADRFPFAMVATSKGSLMALGPLGESG